MTIQICELILTYPKLRLWICVPILQMCFMKGFVILRERYCGERKFASKMLQNKQLTFRLSKETAEWTRSMTSSEMLVASWPYHIDQDGSIRGVDRGERGWLQCNQGRKCLPQSRSGQVERRQQKPVDHQHRLVRKTEESQYQHNSTHQDLQGRTKPVCTFFNFSCYYVSSVKNDVKN